MPEEPFINDSFGFISKVSHLEISGKVGVDFACQTQFAWLSQLSISDTKKCLLGLLPCRNSGVQSTEKGFYVPERQCNPTHAIVLPVDAIFLLSRIC